MWLAVTIAHFLQLAPSSSTITGSHWFVLSALQWELILAHSFQDGNNRWVRWEANENFPEGLAHTTKEIRRRFPNVKHIAMWHSIVCLSL
jgi:hypothetical protein